MEEHRSKYSNVNFVSLKRLSEPQNFVNELSSCHIPTSVDEALKYPMWVQAMKEVVDALLKIKTWIFVPLPEG